MRAVRRLRHRLQRLGHPGDTVVFSRNYSFSLPGSPLDALRFEKVATFLASERLVSGSELLEPVPIDLRSLLEVHDASYLESLADEESLMKTTGVRLSEHQRDRAVEVQRWICGGTVQAGREARRRRRVTINLGGGLHHAHPDEGRGFCIFNDIALAIRALRADGHRRPIAVVDLDLHDGDGTRRFFADDPSVYTYSVHNRHWESPDAEAATAIALGSDVDDATYLDTVRSTLPEILDTFRPDLVFFLAGADPAHDDPLGDWNVSDQGLFERDRFVIEAIREVDAVPVVLLAGGYGPHAWRHSARSLGWLLSGHVIEPPDTETVTLERYREISALLTSAELSGVEHGEDWGLDESDLLGFGGARETRLLGFYTAHGLELAFEQNGLLQRLRDAGFEQPTIGMDVGGPAGDTLRVWSRPDREELLMETRMRRDRLSVPGFEVLFIEWLLLQNPRADFSSDRRALPGQQHPGLRLLKDVVSMFVIACRRIGLDGVAFTPAHYHIAAQSDRYLRFMSPERLGCFRAMRRALDDRPLAEAARVVATGRLVDRATGEPVRWEPSPMVLPVGTALTAHFEAESYAAEAARSEAELDLVVDDERGVTTP